jgi:hypothetical protein
MDMVSRFNSIQINGLFGRSDPTIIQFDDQNDPLKILYGVNGSGKTTILKIIQHSYSWNPVELMKLPFESITYDMNRRGTYSKRTEFSNPINDIRDLVDKSENIDQDIEKYIDECNKTISDFENWRTELKKLENDNFAKTYSNNIDNKSAKVEINDLRTSIKNLQPGFNRIPYQLDQFLRIKRLELLKVNHGEEEYYNHNDTSWDDGLTLLLDYDGEIELELEREFDYSTKLTITKSENRVEQIYFNSIGDFVPIEIGCAFVIEEEKEPVLAFENKIIEKMLKMLQKLWSLRSNAVMLQGLHWRFEDLFSSSKKDYLLRMPDYYDYWDNDWKRIEDQMPSYSIKRPTNSQLLIKRSDTIKIMTLKDTHNPDYVDVDLFLRTHLSNDLVTHAKKGIRRNFGEYDQHYSPSMRTPYILSEFFSYPQVLISPASNILHPRARRNRVAHAANVEMMPEKYFVSLPKILNLSTERKNDNDYFESFVKEFIRSAAAQNITVDELKYKIEQGLEVFSRGLNLYESDTESLTSAINDLFATKFGTQNIIDMIKKIVEDSSEHDFIIGRLMEIISYIDKCRVARNYEIYEYDILNSDNGTISDSEINHKVITPMEITESLSALVRLGEIKRFECYLEKEFPDITFDLFNNSIKSHSKFNKVETKLEFSELSSGIRQKFRLLSSMAMQIIYSENSLILIDEPEISLHLSWQRTFVDDITHFLEYISSGVRTDINQDNDLQNILSIIISTHSPAILANHYHRGQQIGESDISD